MERTVLFPLLACAALTCAAQLSPLTPATLFDHMVEVNAEWKTQDASQFDDRSFVAFENEADRIATHLRFVKARLNDRNSEGLSADQMTHRKELLSALSAYAERGSFPQNHVLPFRNPIFIDPNGTACAVGQLMIESGAYDLAANIDAQMETSYIRDMHLLEINSWANTNGFTEDELAWIQPGYPPTYMWSSLGGGTNGNVNVMMPLPNGDLLVAGGFTEAGGVAVNNVAIWNGASYSALGSGIPNEVSCAAVNGTDIYVGGSFISGSNDLGHWDGTSWTFTTVFDAKAPNINALHFHNGDLYAAGEFVGFAGVDDRIMRYTGNTWETVGEVFNNTIRTLSTHNGQLVAGGLFDGPDGQTDPLWQYVATLNVDTWGPLGDGLDAPVHVLRDVYGTLYAGGDLMVNGAEAFGLASITPGSNSWVAQLPGHQDYLFQNIGQPAIYALNSMGNDILYGGDFLYGPELIGTFGVNICRLENATMQSEPLIGLANGPVNAIHVEGTTVIIAGDFDDVLPHIGRTDLSTGINDESFADAFTIAPNPTSDQLTITLLWSSSQGVNVRLIDNAGRVIEIPVQRNGSAMRIDVRSLAAGTYQVELFDGSTRMLGRFVKE